MAKIYPFSSETLEFFRTGPHEGDTHHWIFLAALKMKRNFTKAGTFQIIRKHIDRTVRHRQIPDREIHAAIEIAHDSDVTDFHPALHWPPQTPDLINTILNTVPPLFDLTPKAEPIDVIPTLFQIDDLVCFGPDTFTAIVGSVDDAINAAKSSQFIVPNPMKARKALNKSGRESARCQANIKTRRFIVTEFDSPHLDKAQQSQLLYFLSRKAHLVMVVDSGGKSLHGWFYVGGKPEKDVAAFFAAAVMIGADKSRFDPCGWLRMPGGTRIKDGKTIPQNIVYFSGRN